MYFSIVYLLLGSGVPEVAVHILSFLHYDDLKNAEHVCSLWRDVIRDGNVWKRCLDMVCHLKF